MKLCIIGSAKRTQSDLQFLTTAKDKFDSVLYVPYSNISLSIKDQTKMMYKIIDLSDFDIIFPRIPRERNLFGYLLFSSLERECPFSPQSFLLTSDRFLMMDALKRAGLPVPELHFVDSVKTASDLIDSLRYPISMRIPGADRSITLAGSPKEARTVLDTLRSFKKPVYIEELFDKKYYQCFVIGGNVEAVLEKIPKEKTDIIFGKGKAKKVKLPAEMNKYAVKAAAAVKAEIAMITLAKKPKKAVFEINLCPPLLEAMKITDIKIDEKIIDHIKSVCTR